jgi:carboxyl-terminal processing protease
MQSKTRVILVLVLGMMLGGGLTFGSGVLAKRSEPQVQTQIPVEELRAFADVFARIKNDYVEKVDDKTLLENAIRGMLSGLDPHSAYLNAEEFKDLQIGTSGEFGGLGIEVGMENGFVKVIAPIDDTPAQRAGVHAGDLIIRLDDTPVKGMTLSDAVKHMRGKPGTKITLTIVREGVDKPLKITITRAVIKVKSVKSRMLEPGYGYVRITQFQSKTGDSLVKAVAKLKKESGGKVKGMVLDLRNNPGGVLGAAVAVSDAFLNSGLIVYTEGRVPDSRLRFTANPGDVLNGAPLIVLVNGGSASASEIVSGALQDHHRAIIMGQRTFGKGSVQTIMPSRGGTAVKLTTARYYTPSGRSIQAEGIVPDVEVKNVKVASVQQPSVEPLKERDLSRHLINGEAEKAKEAAKQKTEEKDAKTDDHLMRTDYQLFEALTLLKGLNIARRAQ